MTKKAKQSQGNSYCKMYWKKIWENKVINYKFPQFFNVFTCYDCYTIK